MTGPNPRRAGLRDERAGPAADAQPGGRGTGVRLAGRPPFRSKPGTRARPEGIAPPRMGPGKAVASWSGKTVRRQKELVRRAEDGGERAPTEARVAEPRSGGVRNPGVGRLVQQPPDPRADREPTSGRGRSGVLSSNRAHGARRVTHTRQSPEFPARFKLALAAVEPTQVRQLHHRLSHAPSIANMVVGTLSLMYRLAGDWGLVSEGCNPCRSVVKYPHRKRERFLTDEEFIRLGQVVDEVETEVGASPAAVAAIRLLMLTGCRKSEILTLRWEHVALDAGELRLRDSKTGARVISLPPMAVKLLAGLPRGPDSPWVIPGRYPGTHLRDLADAWKVIRTLARLDDVRFHDLRHSFASRAVALGESSLMIGKLLGHSQVETSTRYAHFARNSVDKSAARIADSLPREIYGNNRCLDTASQLR